MFPINRRLASALVLLFAVGFSIGCQSHTATPSLADIRTTEAGDLPLETASNLAQDDVSELNNGAITFPHISGDAGNFMVQAGDTITITWHEPPSDAAQYDIYLHIGPADDAKTLLGTDRDPSDGVTIQWEIPEDISGELVGIASFLDGRTVHTSFRPMVYANKAPPSAICTATSTTVAGPVGNRSHLEPDKNSIRSQNPSFDQYVQVIGQTEDGWYQIDGGGDGDGDGDGWVDAASGVRLVGPCDNIPLIDYWQGGQKPRPTPSMGG